MSESAMIASSIPPGSLVSVSLASPRKASSHHPLCSLADECASNFGFDFAEKLPDDAGSYFGLATVLPSSKLVKNAVRLSPNLLLSMGCPASGRTLYVNPILEQPVMNFNECDKSHSSNDCGLSLYNCKELDLSLVSSQSKFIASSMSSRNGLLAEKTNIQDETNNAPPKTPFFPQLKLNSPNNGLFSKPNIEDSRSDSSHLQETSEDIFNTKWIVSKMPILLIMQPKLVYIYQGILHQKLH